MCLCVLWFSFFVLASSVYGLKSLFVVIDVKQGSSIVVVYVEYLLIKVSISISLSMNI